MGHLNEKFMSLNAEKQARILNAALEEFAKKGYKNASTNEIVRKAGISKGLLFHYFGNKKRLYLFLYDYANDVFTNEFFNRLDYGRADLFKRLKQMIELKIELSRKHPDLYEFMVCATLEDVGGIKSEIETKSRISIQDSMARAFGGLDTSGLKEGLDLRRVLEIITWVGQGFANRRLLEYKRDPAKRARFDMRAEAAEFDTYIAILKDAFYK
ncbi:TetR/AcrR family transcriptional regulator [Ethanoligenens harbinense]|uniref:TetR/AcrR family transcriptional regulator n=1 Tax=Ethanoligenens harbinense TaxID=253239 RepID=UPI001FA72A81|nr:TetR/AcrR family transcriptional regulator [Ethanoligenens harbinense]